MILLLDHYDSFTDNLARYLTILGHKPRIVQHDQVDGERFDCPSLKGLVLSPGPGRPEQARTAYALIRRFAGQVPILGICLGHQVIAHSYGAMVTKAPRPMHGYLSQVTHDNRGLFTGLPNPLTVTRYHSLIVDVSSVPAELTVTATTAGDGLIMGLRHKSLPIESVQFHPEALLTEAGFDLLENFLLVCR